jgi:hypothetical protein
MTSFPKLSRKLLPLLLAPSAVMLLPLPLSRRVTLGAFCVTFPPLPLPILLLPRAATTFHAMLLPTRQPCSLRAPRVKHFRWTIGFLRFSLSFPESQVPVCRSVFLSVAILAQGVRLPGRAPWA